MTVVSHNCLEINVSRDVINYTVCLQMQLLYGLVKSRDTPLRAQPFDLYLLQTTAAEQHCGIVAIIQIISRQKRLGDGE